MGPACTRRQQSSDDPVLPLLAATDAAWAMRDRIGLDVAEEPLEEAYGLAPRRPDVLWRLVRHQHAEGWTEPTDRARLFAWAEARSLGLDCLSADPEVATTRQRRGWQEAIPLVEGAAEEACLAWTSLVWARWLALIDTGAAAVDLPVARAFSARASDLPDPELAFLGTWSAALLDATAPTWADGDATSALASLEVLIEQHPDELILQVDRVRWTGSVLTPRYRSELLSALNAASPRTPEARAAVESLAEGGASPSDRIDTEGPAAER